MKNDFLFCPEYVTEYYSRCREFLKTKNAQTILKRSKKMTDREKLILKEARLARLKDSPKNAKAPGVVKALEREIRNLRKKIEKVEE